MYINVYIYICKHFGLALGTWQFMYFWRYGLQKLILVIFVYLNVFYYFFIRKTYSFNNYEITDVYNGLDHLLTNIKYTDLQT